MKIWGLRNVQKNSDSKFETPSIIIGSAYVSLPMPDLFLSPCYGELGLQVVLPVNSDVP